MFTDAAAFDLDIGGWEVGAVTSMNRMFLRAAAFAQDISGWQVGTHTNSHLPAADRSMPQDPVTDTDNMFYGAAAFDTAANAPWYKWPDDY